MATKKVKKSAAATERAKPGKRKNRVDEASQPASAAATKRTRPIEGKTGRPAEKKAAGRASNAAATTAGAQQVLDSLMKAAAEGGVREAQILARLGYLPVRTVPEAPDVQQGAATLDGAAGNFLLRLVDLMLGAAEKDETAKN